MVPVIPSEFGIGGVYMPPLLAAATIAAAASVFTSGLLNRFRLWRFFFYPPLVFLALTVIYTVFIGVYVIGI